MFLCKMQKFHHMFRDSIAEHIFCYFNWNVRSENRQIEEQFISISLFDTC